MTKLYNFAVKSFQKNPHFEEGLKLLDRDGEARPFRSCLYNHNDAPFLLKTAPKWIHNFEGEIIDTETGEVQENVLYTTDDNEASVKRKKKAIKKFSDHFEPLYQSRKVSVFFITLTRSNCATTDIRTLLNVYLKRFKKRNIKVLGYLWVSEVSSNYHWHYHIALAIPRVKWNSIPNWIKPNVIWGQRTKIEFVKKSVASYLGKYISKDNIGRIHNFRGFQVSRKFHDIPQDNR
ncbi:MAG: hypothetical protein ACK5XN_39265 [Bacteroidota bacterium]|jgi:hypothetical protein